MEPSPADKTIIFILCQVDLSDNSAVKDSTSGSLQEMLENNMTLQSLSIRSTGLGEQGIGNIAMALQAKNTTLGRLDVSGNRIGDKGEAFPLQ